MSTSPESYASTCTVSGYDTDLFSKGRLNETNRSSDKDKCGDKYVQEKVIEMSTALDDYRKHLMSAADLNEVYNANKYINTIQESKKTRLEAILNDLKNKENIMRQRARIHFFHQKKQEFYASFLRYAIVMFNAIFIVAALLKMEKIGREVFVTVSAVVVSIFLSMLMLGFISMNQRRSTDWDKIEWARMKMKDDSK